MCSLGPGRRDRPDPHARSRTEDPPPHRRSNARTAIIPPTRPQQAATRAAGGLPPAHLWTPPAIAGAGGAHRWTAGPGPGPWTAQRRRGSFVATYAAAQPDHRPSAADHLTHRCATACTQAAHHRKHGPASREAACAQARSPTPFRFRTLPRDPANTTSEEEKPAYRPAGLTPTHAPPCAHAPRVRRKPRYPRRPTPPRPLLCVYHREPVVPLASLPSGDLQGDGVEGVLVARGVATHYGCDVRTVTCHR